MQFYSLQAVQQSVALLFYFIKVIVMKKNKKGLYTGTFTYQSKRYYIRAKTIREVHRRMEQRKRDLEKGFIVVNPNTRVSRWASEWLKTYKQDKVRKASYDRYQSIIQKYLNTHIGSMRLCEVKPIYLQKIINQLKGLSADFVRKVINTIKNIFEKAKQNDLIASNPALHLEMPHTTPLQLRRALTEEERKHILAVADRHPAGLWVKMLLYCGLRPGETIPLQWDHIDFANNRVNICLAAEKRTGTIKQPKSAAGMRSIPIPKHFTEELKKQKLQSNSACVFTKKDGSIHTETTLRTLWKSFKTEVDIAMGANYILQGQRKKKVITRSVIAKDLVPYSLRHTYCTDLQSAGVPINVARELMGHHDISMTSKIYTHTSSQAISRAAESINEYWSSLQQMFFSTISATVSATS